MIVIRPIKKEDLDKYIKIAFEVDIGITSMPKDREMLTHQVENAINAFSNTSLKKPGPEHYIFILEDRSTEAIAGTCAITAKTGLTSPVYFFRREMDGNAPILRAVQYRDYTTEIGSLYLLPEYRHHGLGHLLSLSRFLFIAAFPERFDKMVFALMQGCFDEKNHSPVWDAIGRHFLDIDYSELLKRKNHHQLNYHSILPHHPIYIKLLPKEIQEVIGKSPPQAMAALNMLLQEGFMMTEEMDIFDAGPRIEAETKEILTVKSNILSTVDSITSSKINSNTRLLSNNKLDFRGCMGAINIKENGKIILEEETAQALNVQIGDSIRYT